MKKGSHFTKEQYEKVVKGNRRAGLKKRGIRPKNLDSLFGKNHWNWKGGINTPARRSVLKNKRNVELLRVSGSHTDGEWIALKNKYGNKCASCRKKKRLTRDHIYPVGHKKCTDNISNIQPLCVSCNVKKGSKVVKYKI